MSFNLQTNQMSNIRQDLRPDISQLTIFKNLELFSKLGLLDNGMAAKAVKHEWPDLILPALSTTVHTAFNDAATSIKVKSTYFGVRCIPQVGTVLSIVDPADKARELMEVTAVTLDTDSGASHTLTVSRQFGSTSLIGAGVSVPADTNVRIMATLRSEGFDVEKYITYQTVNRYNYTQIFAEAIRITGTAQHVDDAGRDGQLPEQQRRIMEKLMKDLHMAAILNPVRLNTTDGNGDARRFFGGLDWIVAQTSGSIVDGIGRELDETVIEEQVTKIRNKGGQANVLLVSHAGKVALDKMKDSRVLQQQSDKTFDNLIDVYVSNIGPLQIVASEDVNDGDMYIFHTDNFKIVPLNGRSFQVKSLNVSGDNDKMLIFGEYTAVGRCFEQFYKVENLTV